MQSDRLRTNVLSAVAELGLSLYESSSWKQPFWNDPIVALSYNDDVVYSKKHNELIYNSHKIAVNINHLQAIGGYSWRVHDIMASNACLVSCYNETIKKRFNNIVPMFTSPCEAKELCVKLLNNENQRKDIVVACNDIIDKSFRFKHILPDIEVLTGVKLQNKRSTATVRYVDCRSAKKETLKYRFIKSIYKICERKLRRKGLLMLLLLSYILGLGVVC